MPAKKVEVKKRVSLPALVKAKPPKDGEFANKYCARIKYKADKVWTAKEDRYFDKVLRKNGFRVDTIGGYRIFKID